MGDKRRHALHYNENYKRRKAVYYAIQKNKLLNLFSKTASQVVQWKFLLCARVAVDEWMAVLKQSGVVLKLICMILVYVCVGGCASQYVL